MGEGKKALIGKNRFYLELYGLKKKKKKPRGKAGLALLKMYRTRVKIYEKVNWSREFSITCPVGGSLVSDPGHLWAASFRPDFGKLCFLSHLRRPGMYASMPGVCVPVSDVFSFQKLHSNF